MKHRKSLNDLVDTTLGKWLLVANLIDANTRSLVQNEVRFGIENANLNAFTRLAIHNEILNQERAK